MKTATLPSLRVDPELRKAAEDALDEGESLSTFLEEAVRLGVQRRNVRKAFLASGLESLREIEEGGGQTYSAEQVLAELEEIIQQAERGPA